LIGGATLVFQVPFTASLTHFVITCGRRRVFLTTSLPAPEFLGVASVINQYCVALLGNGIEF